MTGPERDLALIVAGRAADAGDLRMLLDALGLLPPPGKARAHGRVRSYRAGCRCRAWTAANTEAGRRTRARAAARREAS